MMFSGAFLCHQHIRQTKTRQQIQPQNKILLLPLVAGLESGLDLGRRGKTGFKTDSLVSLPAPSELITYQRRMA
ncbi:MAG: hypothetical protein ACI965_001879 [Paraglaciecola sp.]|jgi:hypothetical protein